MPRRNSLRLPSQPPPIPVPPSLRQSPYLNAPIFKREISTPRLPSDADERWLQDTVPVKPAGTRSAGDELEHSSAQKHIDRRRSVPPRHSGPLTSPTCTSPSSFRGFDSTPSSPTSSVHSRSPSHSISTKYLSQHSLAPPPDAPLSPCRPNGCTVRPVNLNQSLPAPDMSRLGRSSTDQGYFHTTAQALCAPRVHSF
ncbi:hypothetical protein BDZ97DRAFT_1914929 [Flammula alnicola]|nr:hypothetical protein BDZ97DRAFT_1914929 [Flammula alnicola]